MRAALARLLLLRPSLLLLDEPTNHLDIESLEWLEAFLVDYEGTVVLVAHDRYFLNRMVTSIAELGSSDIAVYHGDYDEYLVQRQAPPRAPRSPGAQPGQARRRDRAVHRALPLSGTKARQVRAGSRCSTAWIASRSSARPRIRFGFPQPPRTGRRVASLRAIHKAYGDNVVYTGVDFEVERACAWRSWARTAPAVDAAEDPGRGLALRSG